MKAKSAKSKENTETLKMLVPGKPIKLTAKYKTPRPLTAAERKEFSKQYK